MILPMDVTAEETIIGIESLMQEHFLEVNSSDNLSKLIIGWGKYAVLQQENKLILFGAFSEGVLVGYCALVLVEPLHYTGTTIAVSDTVFLSKSFRHSSDGLRLMIEAEKEAKKRGASQVHWYAKLDTSLEKLLRKRQYKERDVVFSKEV